MRTANPRQEPIRAPRQERSQKRVELILDSAKSVIATKGCASLKMIDIANEAQISIGSIYQYFPNKSAIVRSLAKAHLDENQENIRRAMSEKPQTIDELSGFAVGMLQHYYRQHIDDPVIRDVWMGIATDKEFKELDDEDTVRNSEIMFEQSKHLFPKGFHRKVKLLLLMLINLGVAAVNTTLELEAKDSRFAMAEAEKMVSAFFRSSLAPLAHRPQDAVDPTMPV